MGQNPLSLRLLARPHLAVPVFLFALLNPEPAYAKAQKCKLEKVEKSGGQTSDPKKDKEQTCKKKKAKFIEDDKAEEQCQKKPKPNEACCCADPEGGEQKQSGGGSPQMPQIPQMPQQSSQDQGQQSSAESGATSPTPSSNNVTADSPAKPEDSKTGDGKSLGKAGGTIGFGIVDPSKVTASVVPPAGAPAASTFPGAVGAGSGSSSPFPSSGSSAGAGGRSSAGGGSGGGGGGAGGASLPGKDDGAEAAAAKGGAENPYELSLGGGKLSAPKGFAKGSEADSAVAAAAADSFSKDFSPAAPAAGATAEAEDESGLTIFKMVSYRMREVKKRGGI